MNNQAMQSRRGIALSIVRSGKMGWPSKYEDEIDARFENQANAVKRRGGRPFDLAGFKDGFGRVHLRTDDEADSKELAILEQAVTSSFEKLESIDSAVKIGKKMRAFSQFHQAAHAWVQFVAPRVRRMRPGPEKKRLQLAVASFKRNIGI